MKYLLLLVRRSRRNRWADGRPGGERMVEDHIAYAPDAA